VGIVSCAWTYLHALTYGRNLTIQKIKSDKLGLLFKKSSCFHVVGHLFPQNGKNSPQKKPLNHGDWLCKKNTTQKCFMFPNYPSYMMCWRGAQSL
jgi:hypothetical protein